MSFTRVSDSLKEGSGSEPTSETSVSKAVAFCSYVVIRSSSCAWALKSAGAPATPLNTASTQQSTLPSPFLRHPRTPRLTAPPACYITLPRPADRPTSPPMPLLPSRPSTLLLPRGLFPRDAEGSHLVVEFFPAGMPLSSSAVEACDRDVAPFDRIAPFSSRGREISSAVVPR